MQLIELKAFKKDEDNVQCQLEDLKNKIGEIEENKRNNLIIYGLPNDPHETHSALHQKV